MTHSPETRVEPAGTGGPPADGRPADIKAIPVRHPGRWVTVVILAVLAAMFIHTVGFSHVQRGTVNQTRFGWGVVGDYLFARPILHGVVVTLELTALGMIIGIIGGVLLAVMRMSANPILSSVSWLYIWFFRGTPLLVQIAFWFAGFAYLYPQFSIGVPFGPDFASGSPNVFLPAFVAATVAFATNEAAYMAEIVRAGILSVDEGQSEAASSLGMTRATTLRRIVLPQAMRVIIPPTGNELISMLKNTSLAYYAAVTELFFSAQLIFATNYQTVPLLIVASLWYLVITSVLTVGQYYVERYYARGSSRALPPTPLQRVRSLVVNRRVLPPASTALGAGSAGRH